MSQAYGLVLLLVVLTYFLASLTRFSGVAAVGLAAIGCATAVVALGGSEVRPPLVRLAADSRSSPPGWSCPRRPAPLPKVGRARASAAATAGTTCRARRSEEAAMLASSTPAADFLPVGKEMPSRRRTRPMRWFWVLACSALVAVALAAPPTSAATSDAGAGPAAPLRLGAQHPAAGLRGQRRRRGAGGARARPRGRRPRRPCCPGSPAPQAFFTTATPDQPANFADQLEKYDAFNTVDPGSLTAAQLPSYFKDASLGVDPEDVVRTEQPRPGVTIRWDTDGVPHITGRTDADVAYGAGSP